MYTYIRPMTTTVLSTVVYYGVSAPYKSISRHQDGFSAFLILCASAHTRIVRVV